MPWWDEDRLSAFETIRVSGGRPVDLAAHWKRLVHSQKTVLRPVPSTRLLAVVRRAARDLPGGEGGLRVEVTTTSSGEKMFVSILPRPGRLGAQMVSGVRVVTAVGPGGSAATQLPQAKHGNRLPGVLVWAQSGFDAPFEYLWCDASGGVCEGTFSNIFIVRKGILITPPTTAGALSGTVRESVFGWARRRRIAARAEMFTRHELFTAEEAFLTNSLIGIVPICDADGRTIGSVCPGPVTRKLQQAYRTTFLRRG